MQPGFYTIGASTKNAMGKLRTWLAAHGIEPNLVPADARIVVGGGRVAIDVFLTREGHPYHVRGDNSPLARGRLTVPLLDHLELPRCLMSDTTTKTQDRTLLPTGGIRT